MSVWNAACILAGDACSLCQTLRPYVMLQESDRGYLHPITISRIVSFSASGGTLGSSKTSWDFHKDYLSNDSTEF